MQIFQTIEKSKRIFDTGNSPILVLCNDLNEWVCKYDPSSKSLFNEVLASKFAEIWEIQTPPICLIKVKEEHISDFIPRIQPSMIHKNALDRFT